MLQRNANTTENCQIAERTYRIRLEVPDIAAQIRPGQFVMCRIPGTTDPLLGRPFALYDTVLDPSGQPRGIDIVYLVVGKMTTRLAEVQVGETLEVWGPLGNGFLDIGMQEQVNLVAGGIGQTPFLAYTRQLLGQHGYAGNSRAAASKKVSIYYGVRSRALAAGIDDFQAAGAEVHLASDDGSIGMRGYVTQLLERDAPPGPLIGCGPEPMLHTLARIAERWQRLCHVSLETPMACGFGVCFSCVTRVKIADGWDYKRVCVDGPVFNANALCWDSLPSTSGETSCRN